MGNVSLAADAMHVSQPTVTVNIRKLEDEHGVDLFKRSSRGVVLTDYGRILYEHVKVMARLDAHAAAEIRARKQLDRPSLRVGCGFAWWSRLIQPSLAEFRAQNPEVTVHAEICSSFDGLRHLHSGDVQCFLGSRVHSISNASAYKFEHLFSVEDTYFVRDGHPLCNQRVRRSNLKQFPRLDVAPLVNRHLGIVEAPFTVPEPDWSHPLRTPLSTNSVMAGWDLLRSSDAYLIYPVSVTPEFRNAGIVALDVEDRPHDTVEIGIYTLGDITPKVVVSTFLELLRKQDRSVIKMS
jgi:DNA-binding transcriptional LysR family regulator